MKLDFTNTALLRPPARDDLTFEGGISHPDIFIWDSWSYKNKNGDIHLYTLAQSRNALASSGVDIQTERDHLPHHHRLFVSQDDGKSWRDKGPVFSPSLGGDAFDSRSIWTGSAVDYQGVIIGGYTGIRPAGPQHPLLQSVGLSISEDGGYSFRKLMPDAISDAVRDYDQIRAAGYYLDARDNLGNKDGEAGMCAMAWRDPGLIVDPSTGQLHAFWSAKSDAHQPQEAVLAHGIIHDVLTKPRLELLPPVRFPDAAQFTQSEVPQLIHAPKEGAFYLVLSTTDKTSELQTDAQIETAARVYRATSLDNAEWTFAGRIINKEDKLYPATIIDLKEGPNGVSHLRFSAPYNRSSGDALMQTIPPLRTAVIENGKITSIIKPEAPAAQDGAAAPTVAPKK
jgi:hypothetical protein